MALPQLTDEQRKEALEKAAQARHERAELREKIKSGKVTLEEVLDSDDPIANRMKVSPRLWTSSASPLPVASRALAPVSASSSSRRSPSSGAFR